MCLSPSLWWLVWAAELTQRLSGCDPGAKFHPLPTKRLLGPVSQPPPRGGGLSLSPAPLPGPSDRRPLKPPWGHDFPRPGAPAPRAAPTPGVRRPPQLLLISCQNRRSRGPAAASTVTAFKALLTQLRSRGPGRPGGWSALLVFHCLAKRRPTVSARARGWGWSCELTGTIAPSGLSLTTSTLVSWQIGSVTTSRIFYEQRFFLGEPDVLVAKMLPKRVWPLYPTISSKSR